MQTKNLPPKQLPAITVIFLLYLAQKYLVAQI